ncbi:MAG TPA: phenylacetate--CoA ligase family protein [Candidatus Wunengus sp. YC61]|uniref:phenylacetate--CoA ligase family protein n=1 Tax=Candidatus Wunengus sp. YC61 TaxID=3367698 RepID=UPI00402554A1
MINLKIENNLVKKTLEFKSKQTIEDEQIRLLREMVCYAGKRSPFYKSMFRKKGIKHVDLKTIHDLTVLPLTSREQLQKYNSSFYCVDKKEIADIVSTTGTTGEPVFIVLTKHDLKRLMLNEVYSFSCAGAKESDLFHLAVTIDNLFMAGIAYYLGIVELGAGVYRAGMHNIKRQILLMQKLKPTGIMTVPSFLLQLGKEMKEEGINPSSLSVKKALLVGDSIRDQNFHLSGVGELLHKTWPLDLYSTFGNSEAAISYCECKYKHGGHEHSDLVITEIIDENGNVVPDGEMGELVLTTLQTRGMPLLRYCTGDITFKITKPCKCGRCSSRIGPIMGRKAHMLKYRGTKVYPKAIENAIAGINGVHNYVIEAFTGDDYSDKVVVKVGSKKGNESFKRLLCAKIAANARVIPVVKFVPIQKIYSLQSDNGKNRKPKTFIDHRNKKAK